MIPKKIHYCWFGGNPLPESVRQYIASWKKFCPDYEIVEWNECNFNVECNAYVKEAYQAQKWAFVSDVARLYALTNYGGIYLDTDVEIIRSLDSLLQYPAVVGFETNDRLSTAFMACEEGNPLFLEFQKQYENQHFLRTDGSYNLTTNVARLTDLCATYGLKKDGTRQTLNSVAVFPRDYFSPKDMDTKELHQTTNTYAIHFFDGSWRSQEDLYIEKIGKKWKRIPLGSFIAKFIGIVKFRGLLTATREMFGWLARRK